MHVVDVNNHPARSVVTNACESPPPQHASTANSAYPASPSQAVRDALVGVISNLVVANTAFVHTCLQVSEGLATVAGRALL